MSILNRIVCHFKGHVSEPFLTETDVSIRTKRCKRCKRPMGFGRWKLKAFTPPWLTPEQWSQYCEEKEQELRDSVFRTIENR